MIIKTLAENVPLCEEFGSEHGLSLYIETSNARILFDTGASNLFLENAKKLGVNIADIDYLVISHGHYDHGGGLKAFMEVNHTAEIFLHEQAFEKHYALRPNGKMEYIGLQEQLIGHKRIVSTSDRFFISKGLQVFSGIKQLSVPPASNLGLLKEEEGTPVQDTFAHEQNLIIEEGELSLLITGCAHNGIVNILEHYKQIKGQLPKIVIGGFHLSSRLGSKLADKVLDQIAEYLLSTKAKYYTCHCTGMEAFTYLKQIMGDNIEYLPSGSQIII